MAEANAGAQLAFWFLGSQAWFGVNIQGGSLRQSGSSLIETPRDVSWAAFCLVHVTVEINYHVSLLTGIWANPKQERGSFWLAVQFWRQKC